MVEGKGALKKKLCIFLILYLSFGFYFSKARYRLNDTYSVPPGIWKIDSKAGGVRKGDYAAIPPEAQPAYQFAVGRGYLNKGKFLLKKIAAVSGDVVDYDDETKSVTVNGEWLPHTAVSSADSAGRPLRGTKFPVRLKTGEAWVSSENIRGFDSRYFGPVSADLVIKAVPIFLF
jgi:conjugative transfer signal peptidase TraF